MKYLATIVFRAAAVLALGFAFGIASSTVLAQDPGVSGQVSSHARINFAALAAEEAAHPPAPAPRVVLPHVSDPTHLPVPREARRKTKGPATAQLTTAQELTIQTSSAEINSPPPTANFAALGDDDTVVPPDTMGAVGPNHLMVTLNSQIRIQDRSGNTLSTVSEATFWNGLGVTGIFGPHVIYDPYGGRWIFSAASDAQIGRAHV